MSNETGFTHGPWSYVNGDSYIYTASGVAAKRPAIKASHASENHWQANAHLIAAAPELYDALKVVHDNLYALLNDPEIGPEARKLYDFEDVAAMARPLAKARGES